MAHVPVEPPTATGVLHSVAELAELAELAARYDAVVVSDEIWAPLTMPGVDFTSFLAVSETAREVGLAISSASKAFNLAGLKCAFVINGNPGKFAVPRSALSGAVGHFGALAGEAAMTLSLDWLDEMRAALASNLDLMETLLAEHLPRARWRRDAGFVADRPARLPARRRSGGVAEGRVALSNGPAFGTEGRVRAHQFRLFEEIHRGVRADGACGRESRLVIRNTSRNRRRFGRLSLWRRPPRYRRLRQA